MPQEVDRCAVVLDLRQSRSEDARSLLDLRATLSSAAAKYKTPVPQQKTQGDT